MNAFLSRRTIAWSTIVIAMTGCPSTETAPSRANQSVPASASPSSPPTNPATASGDLVLHVDGLTCEGCAWQIRDTLERVDGVQDVRTTVANKRVVVTYDSKRTSAPAVRGALKDVGYDSVEISE